MVSKITFRIRITLKRSGKFEIVFSLFKMFCRDQRPSDDTLAAVLSILHEVIKKTAPFAVSLYEVSGCALAITS